jgi:hypothetical protein
MFPRVIFVDTELDPAVAQMLTSKLHYIRASSTRVEQKRQREARLATVPNPSIKE